MRKFSVILVVQFEVDKNVACFTAIKISGHKAHVMFNGYLPSGMHSHHTHALTVLNAFERHLRAANTI